MSIARWLRTGAAVAAVAAFNIASPQAAQAAATPCGASSETLSQGYVLDQYMLVKYDRLDDGSGAKLCFQAGGTSLGQADTYGVIDIPLPTASIGDPRNDNNSDTCIYYGGEALYDSYTPGVGSFRISYLVRSTDVQLCSEGYDANGTRIISRRTLIPVPQWTFGPPDYGTIAPAPARDTSLLTPYPAGAPSSECSGPNGRRVLDYYFAGALTKLSYTAPDLGGTTKVCVRANGVGGRAAVNAGALPEVGVYGDRAPCDQVVHHMNAPRYLHVDQSSSGNPRSICLSTSPTSTTRLRFSQALLGLVTFTPDP